MEESVVGGKACVGVTRAPCCTAETKGTLSIAAAPFFPEKDRAEAAPLRPHLHSTGRTASGFAPRTSQRNNLTSVSVKKTLLLKREVVTS